MVLKFLFVMCLVVLGSAEESEEESDIALRIVGGEIADIAEFPYVVSLQLENEHICGGTILNEDTVLTAAHCVFKNLTVVVGTNDLSNDSPRFKVVDALRHPKYKTYLYYDVALLRIDGRFTFGPRVRPVVLEENRISNDIPCVSCGWGRLNASSDTSTILRYINLKTISTQVCHIMYKPEDVEIGFQHICTLTKIHKGVCFGDSGGPLLNLDEKQIGIVSFIRPCGIGFPDVFASISHFYNWINEYA